MIQLRTRLITVAGVVALAAPAAAIAGAHGHHHGKPVGEHGHGHGKGLGKSHPGQYIFKGTYNGDGAVHVLHGNSRVRKGGFVGQDVQFDLTNTKLTVADTNGDSTVDASDVVVGDRVLVQAKLPKPDPGAQPFPARHLVDQTNPAADDEGTGETGDTGATGDTGPTGPTGP